MKNLLLSVLVLFVSSAATAQSTFQWQAESSLSVNANEFSANVGLGALHNVGKQKRLLLGYGLRLGGYAGQNITYITALAALTLDEKIDTFTMASPALVTLNTYVSLGYQLNDKWAFMFDIDVIGISMGGTSSGQFSSGPFPAFNGVYDANPTSPNILLVGDNDRGSLNSTLAARYRLNENMQLKFGFTYLFTEYTTVQELSYANDRFRRKSGQLMLGLNYQF